MESTPGETREICGGIQGDGWDSLLEGKGGGVILTLFYNQRLGGWGIQKTSGGFSSESHLTQGTLSCKISPLPGKLLKFARGSTLLGRR